MTAIRAFAYPVNDTVTVRIPKEYGSCSFEVFVVPVPAHDAEPRPVWAGLCEDAIARNANGPHDMDSIRASIKSAERLESV